MAQKSEIRHRNITRDARIVKLLEFPRWQTRFSKHLIHIAKRSLGDLESSARLAFVTDG